MGTQISRDPGAEYVTWFVRYRPEYRVVVCIQHRDHAINLRTYSSMTTRTSVCVHLCMLVAFIYLLSVRVIVATLWCYAVLSEERSLIANFEYCK